MAKLKITKYKNNWFGFGIRGVYSKDDFFIMALRFAWWQWWFDWTLGDQE